MSCLNIYIHPSRNLIATKRIRNYSPQSRQESQRSARMMMKEEDRLSKEIIGAAIEVHRHLGAGLLESAYEECPSKELEIRPIVSERQKPLELAV